MNEEIIVVSHTPFVRLECWSSWMLRNQGSGYYRHRRLLWGAMSVAMVIETAMPDGTRQFKISSFVQKVIPSRVYYSFEAAWDALCTALDEPEGA